MSTMITDFEWYSDRLKSSHGQLNGIENNDININNDLILKIKSIAKVEGILIFDKNNELIYGNDTGYSMLDQLSKKELKCRSLPAELIAICQWMYDSRQIFKGQHWLMNFKIILTPLRFYHIHARWIKGETPADDFVLLKMEDQNQFIRDIALEEARQYGLTQREQEVWLLHRQNNTYKEIAQKLGITPNTVKKHMKSIMTKQRALEN